MAFAIPRKPCRFAQSNQPALQTCVGRLPPGPPYENAPNAPLSCKQVTGPGGFPFVRCDNYVPQFDGVQQHAAGTSVRYGVSPDAAGSSSILYRKHGHPSATEDDDDGISRTLQEPGKTKKPSSSSKDDRSKNYMYAIAGLSLAAVLAAIVYMILTHLRS